MFVKKVISRGSQVTLIRVNPDNPFAPEKSMSVDHLITIKTGGLNSIQKINDVISEIAEK